MQKVTTSGFRFKGKKVFGLAEIVGLTITCFYYLYFLSIWIDNWFYAFGSIANCVIGVIITGNLFLHLLILICIEGTSLRGPYLLEIKKSQLNIVIYFFALVLLFIYSTRFKIEKSMPIHQTVTEGNRIKKAPVNFFVSCREGAFLYSKPDNYSKVLTLIPTDSVVLLLMPSNNDEFNVLTKIDDTLKVFDGRFKGYYFFKVKYKNRTGYVINQLLTQRRRITIRE